MPPTSKPSLFSLLLATLNLFPHLINSHPTTNSPNPPYHPNDLPPALPGTEPFPVPHHHHLRTPRRDTPAPSNRTFTRYLALGDSFSAGPGWEDGAVIPGASVDGDCMRRTGSWPEQLKALLHIPDAGYAMAACSGANLTQILTEQVTGAGPASLAADSVDLLPGLVTVTMGGNEDLGFANMVEACPYGGGVLAEGKCKRAIETAQGVVDSDGMRERVKAVLEGVVARGPVGGMTVLVMGYPSLYNADTRVGKDCWMKKATRASIDGLSTSINAMLKGLVEEMQATAQGFTMVFADPNDGGKWDGHRMCEAKNRAWLQGLPDMKAYSWDDFFKGLFHPTRDGHTAMAQTALEALQGLGA